MTSDIAPKSCFVIAPYDAPLGEFLERLRQEHIEPFYISDFLRLSKLAISNLRATFRSVDLVIALLFPDRPLHNVYFEVGMAMGLGRPTLIFAPSTIQMPSDLAGLQVNHVDLQNLENTIPTIRKWLEPKQREGQSEVLIRAAGPSEKSRARLKGPSLRNAIQRIRNIWAHSHDPEELESGLFRLLTEVGWTVVEARPSVRGRAPDLAVWIDEVQKEVGNPLAIEIKSSLTRAGLDHAVAQLSRYLSSSGAKAGVVVYNGPELPLNRNIAQSSPPILAFSFDQLTELIEEEKFPATLKSAVAAAKRPT